MPSGPWNLCGATVMASTPSSRKLTGILPTAWTASVWTRMRRSRQSVGDFGDRLNDARFVVGEHDADDARSACSPGRARLLPSRPARQRRHWHRLAKPSTTQPRRRSSSAVADDAGMLDGGDDDRAELAPGPGLVPAKGSKPRSARLFASVPPLVKMTLVGVHAAGFCAEQLGNSLAGLFEHPPGAGGRGRAGWRDSRRSRARRESSPRRRAGRSASWSCGRDRYAAGTLVQLYSACGELSLCQPDNRTGACRSAMTSDSRKGGEFAGAARYSTAVHCVFAVLCALAFGRRAQVALSDGL